MIWTLLLMFAVLVLAGLVALYVAFPHRGEEMPYAPGLGEAMRTARERLPILDEDEARGLQQR